MGSDIHKIEKFWLIVYSNNTGEYKNATFFANEKESEEKISEVFERMKPEYSVIDIGRGGLPPKSFRSLSYVDEQLEEGS